MSNIDTVKAWQLKYSYQPVEKLSLSMLDSQTLTVSVSSSMSNKHSVKAWQPKYNVVLIANYSVSNY